MIDAGSWPPSRLGAIGGLAAAMGKMTRPKARVVVQRDSENDKRELREPMPSAAQRAALAARVKYEGSAKHKYSPRAFGLKPAPRATDDTMCDVHAQFTPADMVRAVAILQRGVMAGLIGHNTKQGDPTILWALDDNGWIYEARITTPTQTLYHGYPVLIGDPFAKKVIARYRGWAYLSNDPTLIQIHTNALDLYR